MRIFACSENQAILENANTSDHQILLAPLQGLTDFRFRQAFHAVFSGIDVSYSPWIRLNHDKSLKKGHTDDVQPKHNIGYKVIPQIMTNDAEDFIFLAKYLHDLGHEEMNWNLGCPYPMVAKRGMGSGLLCNPQKVTEVLEEVLPKIPIKLSIKMRLGYENNTDTPDLMPYLNDFPLTEIIIHGRTAKQMYTGVVDQEQFGVCVERSKHNMVYNGDIASYAELAALQEKFPTVRRWMLGRGVIANPFLPGMIARKSDTYPENEVVLFMKFHNLLMENYGAQLSGDKHLLMKMSSFWEYFAKCFSDPHQVYKRVNKAKNMQAYQAAVAMNLADGFGA